MHGSLRSVWDPARWPTSTHSWRRAGPATRSSCRRRRRWARHASSRRRGRRLRPDIRRVPDRRGSLHDRHRWSARAGPSVRPKLITIGGSLNLLPHPVEAVRSIADDVGAAAAVRRRARLRDVRRRAWPNPLAQGADPMTMSTYKSLGGPAGGLLARRTVPPGSRGSTRSRIPGSPPTSTQANRRRSRSRCWIGSTVVATTHWR